MHGDLGYENAIDPAIVSSDSEVACTNTATGAKEEEETSIDIIASSSATSDR